MPSKFGEFRFVGSKAGKTMKVTAQAQKKVGPAWVKTTTTFSVGNTSVGNPQGLVVSEVDTDPDDPATTWKAMPWDDADAKRLVVRVREVDFSGEVESGYILTPTPATGKKAIGASFVVLPTAAIAYIMNSATTVQAATLTTGTWGSGDYVFLP